jgi:hypothetical protein
MNYANLDMIVRRSLLEKGYPIHYYAEYLFHAASCIRQLSTDTLKIVNSAHLPINKYYAVDLPPDFVDDVSLCVPTGSFIRPVPKNDSINPLRIVNSTSSQFEKYKINGTREQQETVFGINPSWLWYWNVNDYGEPTGRFYGASGGERANGYKLLKERNQIQLTETFTGDSVILIYISDGQSANNATQIDMLAFSAIQAYIDWKTSPNASKRESYEARTYFSERRLLRAKLNDLTATDIKNIVRKNFMASIKN